MDSRSLESGRDLPFKHQAIKLIETRKTTRMKNPLIFKKTYFQKNKQTISFQPKTKMDYLVASQEASCACY